MRVLLKLTLDCEAETAWQRIQQPAMLQAVSAPIMKVRSLEDEGFSETWTDAPHRVELRLFGLVPFGKQLIKVSRREGHGSGINILRDTGGSYAGPLALINNWDHRLAISALPDGRALFRDQLRVSASWLTPLAWPALWLMWQARGAKIRRLARDW